MIQQQIAILASDKLFNSVAGDANQVPVSLDNASDGALRLMDWQQKTNLGPTINKFLNRITSPKLGPLTYEEARDYQSLLGNLSANEKMNLPPMVKSDVDSMLAGFKTDVGNAADQVGRGSDYYSAMNQYRQASPVAGSKVGGQRRRDRSHSERSCVRHWWCGCRRYCIQALAVAYREMKFGRGDRPYYPEMTPESARPFSFLVQLEE